MSAVMEQDLGTLARTASRPHREGVDPRTRRYGYAPGAWGMELHPRLTGRQGWAIPQGCLVKFETFDGMAEQNFDVDPFSVAPSQTTRDLTAGQAIENVKRAFVAPPYYDWGFRELDPLTSRADAEAARLFGVAHPAFAQVGIDCPEGLTVCVTCRLKWLTDARCQMRMDANSAPELKALYDILLDANTTYYKFAAARWSSVKAELKRREKGEPGLATLTEAEEHVRLQLHAIPPEEEQLQIAAQYGEAQSRQLAEVLERQGTQFTDALAKIGENKPSAEVEGLKAQVAEMRRQQEETDRRMQAFLDAQEGKPEPKSSKK